MVLGPREPWTRAIKGAAASERPRPCLKPQRYRYPCANYVAQAQGRHSKFSPTWTRHTGPRQMPSAPPPAPATPLERANTQSALSGQQQQPRQSTNKNSAPCSQQPSSSTTTSQSQAPHPQKQRTPRAPNASAAEPSNTCILNSSSCYSAHIGPSLPSFRKE